MVGRDQVRSTVAAVNGHGVPGTTLTARMSSSRPTFQTFTTRFWILTCFYVTIALAMPFWLQTTTIERLPLPRHEVDAWEAKLPCPIRLRHTLTLRLAPYTVLRQHEHEVGYDIARALEAAGDGIWRRGLVRSNEGTATGGMAGNATLGQDNGSPAAPLEHAACIDWDVRLNEVGRLDPSSLHYVISVVQGDATESFLSTSTTRHFTINALHPLEGRPPAEVAWSLASQLSRLLQLPYRDLFFQDALPTIGQAQAQAQNVVDETLRRIDLIESDKRQIPYTRNVRLVFSLINEDVSAPLETEDRQNGASGASKRRSMTGVAGWHSKEVEAAFKRRIAPLIESMQGTYRIHTELQTIWYAPLQFTPERVDVVESIPTPDTLPASSEADVEARTSDQGDQPSEAAQAAEAAAANDEPTSELIALASTKRSSYHLIRRADLQVFVNAGEWGLASSGGGGIDASSEEQQDRRAALEATTVDETLTALVDQHERTLHFVIYVPRPSVRPLRIATDGHSNNVSEATGWLIPQWGGVSLYNLGYEASSEGDSASDQGEAVRHHGVHTLLAGLSSDELDRPLAAFEKQLRTLLGLRPTYGIDPAQEVQATPSADARLAVALDGLVRRRLMASLRETVRTLGSIVRLVDKIANLGVGKQVQRDVHRALEMIQGAAALTDDPSATILRQGASSPVPAPLSPLRALLDHVHAAELLSARAFFNPAMLGQLYFPDEHKYAVYTPLFGPLAMPLLVAALRLVQEWKQARRNRRLAAAA